MTSPAGPSPHGQRRWRAAAVEAARGTACPTGIAHTYMAAEKLSQAAESRGIDMKVETQGSIGAENILGDNDVRTDGVIVAVDKDADLSRFAGKRVLVVGVAEGICHPERLIEQVRSAPAHTAGGTAAPAAAPGGRERSVAYKSLMNGVSYMIPFVVVGGLLIAISLSLGGHPDPSGGLVIPKHADADSPTPEGVSVAGSPTADAVPEVLPAILSGFLTEQTVKVRLDAADKKSAIREMSGLLARTGKVADVNELVATALRREEQGTTGLGEEIAIPHAKTDAVSAPVVGFARSAEGVEWDSPDGTKARLVFMIAVPEAAAGDEHLRILAQLSRKLVDAGFRERPLAAGDESAVLGVLSEVG